MLRKGAGTDDPSGITTAHSQCASATARVDDKSAGKRSRERGAEERGVKAGRTGQGGETEQQLHADARHTCRATSPVSEGVSDEAGFSTSEGYEKVIK